jgi:hypothetical protein
MNSFNQQVRCDQCDLIWIRGKGRSVITDCLDNVIGSNQAPVADFIDETEFSDIT